MIHGAKPYKQYTFLHIRLLCVFRYIFRLDDILGSSLLIPWHDKPSQNELQEELVSWVPPLHVNLRHLGTQ